MMINSQEQPSRSVLITGGAGFIGSHLADELIHQGYQVRLLDVLLPQVHGDAQQRPEYLHAEADLVIGDVRDASAVRHALDGIDVVFHLAAAVGVGQSMYEVADYTSTNTYGTAVLLEALAERPIERLIVASSMSVYGEGVYESSDGRVYDRVDRTDEQLRRDEWEPLDDAGQPLKPVPTPETKAPFLASTYALTKFDQEQLCLLIGRAYGIPTVALRLFNVYGARQALSNPYTGVLAIFLARVLNGKAPLIYEDGRQKRDFVHVRDVVQAMRLAMEYEPRHDRVFNIGSGRQYSVREIAEHVIRAAGVSGVELHITGQYRAGDIRHCFADIGRARHALGYEPKVSLEEGLDELAEWLTDQSPQDRVEHANAELAVRGLTV